MRMRVVYIVMLFLSAVLVPLSSGATTKGLSQIVTPDLQKPGDFSLSYQQESPVIGNPEQLQAELGFTPWAEGAIFKGFEPNEYIFGTEFGLLQKEPYLLTAGFINLSTRDGKMQPFTEFGYYLEHSKLMIGAISANSEAELILGYAYDFDSHWRAQVDFQSGDSNFSTLGFTYTLNENFQFNPALYFSNSDPRNLAGYIVFTFSKKIWNAKENPSAPTEL
jgi:hypothetical protein